MKLGDSYYLACTDCRAAGEVLVCKNKLDVDSHIKNTGHINYEFINIVENDQVDLSAMGTAFPT